MCRPSNSWPARGLGFHRAALTDGPEASPSACDLDEAKQIVSRLSAAGVAVRDVHADALSYDFRPSVRRHKHINCGSGRRRTCAGLKSSGTTEKVSIVGCSSLFRVRIRRVLRRRTFSARRPTTNLLTHLERAVFNCPSAAMARTDTGDVPAASRSAAIVGTASPDISLAAE